MVSLRWRNVIGIGGIGIGIGIGMDGWRLKFPIEGSISDTLVALYADSDPSCVSLDPPNGCLCFKLRGRPPQMG
jgi:hypothetical protein